MIIDISDHGGYSGLYVDYKDEIFRLYSLGTVVITCRIMLPDQLELQEILIPKLAYNLLDALMLPVNDRQFTVLKSICITSVRTSLIKVENCILAVIVHPPSMEMCIFNTILDEGIIKPSQLLFMAKVQVDESKELSLAIEVLRIIATLQTTPVKSAAKN